MSRDLFGGAMTCVIPTRFVDVSSFREVPDNQEVLGDPNTDQSVIVEVVEPLAVNGQQIVVEHFDELADVNESQEKVVQRIEVLADPSTMPNLNAQFEKYAIYGTQLASKHREQAKNVINVYMCVVRLPAPFSSDIVITLNDPVRVNPASSSAQFVQAHPTAEQTMELWRTILRSFNIRDYGLFG